MIPILDLKKQYLSLETELNDAVRSVLENGRFIMGPNVKLFENEIAAYIGTKHAVGVNSGTDALHLALRALDIGPGDEVITTPFTFVATTEAIGIVGAKPVFVDIDPNTFNIDVSEIEKVITPRTKAILPIHLYGRPAAMSAIMDIARRRRLAVVEDCAQSIGAKLDRTMTGAIGDIGCFSFFPSKNLGACGDAGMITTNSDALAERMRNLRAHGAKVKYHHEELGVNSRLDELQAAILRVKLPHLESWISAR
nr:DegT/DnrJ/EryC1/StrS family aminotransferase [Pseudomonadota bacterium]